MRFISFLPFFLPFLIFAQTPKVVVGVVVDQMCYDYLYRFEHHFVKDGFKRFLDHGVNCRNTTYNYVPTYTGPGHASIYTGTTPYNHGIIGNDWYNRSTNQPVNCVFDSSARPIGNPLSNFGQVSPHHLETTTITDQLKMTYPSSKVYSISLKDRSAVLPGGHMSDGTYWFDYNSGNFITSSYYMKALPGWVQSFNHNHPAENYIRDWELINPISTYSRSIDNSPYEVTVMGAKSPTFPYKFSEYAQKDFNLFTITPFANTLLTDFACKLIENEQIGKQEATDMLCISYSTPDIAGHAFGPYSLEVEDIYIRLDLEIAKLFHTLDQKIGKHNYVVFLTADHAVVPVPQQLIDKKLPGGYFDVAFAVNQIKETLTKSYGCNLILSEKNQNIYLNKLLIDSLKLTCSEIQQQVASQIRTFPEVKVAVVASDLERGVIDDDWMKMILNGYSKERSGDVLFLLKPGYLPVESSRTNEHKGTSHGSAYNYDTHVPLLWYGNRMASQEIFRPIAITDIAATLVHLLNLQRVGSMTGSPIIEILGH